MRAAKTFVGLSSTELDNIFIGDKLLSRIILLVPGIVLYLLLPLVLFDTPDLLQLVNTIINIYMVVVGVLILFNLLDSIIRVYRTFDISKRVPIRSFVQALKIAAIFFAALLIISNVIGRSATYLLSGIGALTAILMLIFKDSILGFVAGIQLSANQMISRGDWIEMPGYNASGEVLDVALTTVKVQNADHSITTIPTYALISSSFKNYVGIKQKGARRLKRCLYIDINTIRMCDREMLEKFTRIHHLTQYMLEKMDEIDDYNTENKIDYSMPVNGRAMTNIGTFRAYINSYLSHHAKVNPDLTFMVRQLEATPNGLPIEIYVYLNEVSSIKFESMASDIFDHLYAVLPEFDLRAFQTTTGYDMRMALEGMARTNGNGHYAGIQQSQPYQ